jgi:hypothetical protein
VRLEEDKFLEQQWSASGVRGKRCVGRQNREKLRSPGEKVCTVHCGSFTMHCMVASSIPCKLSLCADRAHACAGDSHVSSGIDVACPTTQNVLAIASPHELHGDSWPSSSTGTSSFCCNQQYSVTAVTTSTGSIAERYAYSAYGQPTILDASTTRDGGCGKNGGTASKKFKFRLPNRHKTKGYLVQEVTVTCQPGSCLVWLILVHGCPEASRRHCLCNLQEPKTFKYYEAWRVGLNNPVPTNPPTMGGTSYDDDANSGPRANETCGISRQDGDLRFFEDSVTGDLSTQHAWAPKPTTYYGSDTGCGTTAGTLYSMDGKNGPPGFWGDNAIATGSRSAEFEWNCCGCKKEKDRSNTVK